MDRCSGLNATERPLIITKRLKLKVRPGPKRGVTWRRKDLQLHRRGGKLKVLRRRLNYVGLDGGGGLGDGLRMVVNTT